MKFEPGDRAILVIDKVKDLNENLLDEYPESCFGESPGVCVEMVKFFQLPFVTITRCDSSEYNIRDDSGKYSYKETWFEPYLVPRKIKLKDLI